MSSVLLQVLREKKSTDFQSIHYFLQQTINTLENQLADESKEQSAKAE